MEQFVSEYLMNLEERNLSKNTIEAYTRDMKKFTKYLKDNNLNSTEMTVKDLNSYIDELLKSGSSKATIDRMTSILRSYYDYLKDRKIIEENIAINIKKIKEKKKVKKENPILTKKQIYKFLNEPDTKTIKGKRDKAILELSYATGMKVSEIIKIKIQDIDLKRANIICGNRRNLRTIPIGTIANEAIKIYLEEARPMITDDKDKYVFVNLNGNQLTRQGLWKIIKEYSNSCGLGDKVTPHILRNSFAAHLLQNGTNIQVLQYMMGHADISLTEQYLDYIDLEVRSEYLKANHRV